MLIDEQKIATMTNFWPLLINGPKDYPLALNASPYILTAID